MSSLKVFAALILVLPCILCFPNTGSSGSNVWTAEDEAIARERIRGGNLGKVVIRGSQAGSSSKGVRGSSSSGISGSSASSRLGGSSGSSSTGFSTGSSSTSSSTRSSSHRSSLDSALSGKKDSALSGKKNQIRISQIMDRDSSDNSGFITGKNTKNLNPSSERGCKSCHLVHAHAKAKHGHGHA